MGSGVAGARHCQPAHTEHQRGDSTADWGGLSHPGLPGQQVTTPCPLLSPRSTSPNPWDPSPPPAKGLSIPLPTRSLGTGGPGAPRAGTLCARGWQEAIGVCH